MLLRLGQQPPAALHTLTGKLAELPRHPASGSCRTPLPVCERLGAGGAAPGLQWHLRLLFAGTKVGAAGLRSQEVTCSRCTFELPFWAYKQVKYHAVMSVQPGATSSVHQHRKVSLCVSVFCFLFSASKIGWNCGLNTYEQCEDNRTCTILLAPCPAALPVASSAAAPSIPRRVLQPPLLARSVPCFLPSKVAPGWLSRPWQVRKRGLWLVCQAPPCPSLASVPLHHEFHLALLSCHLLAGRQAERRGEGHTGTY